MRDVKLTAILIGLALISISQYAQAAPAYCDHEGCAWLATGNVVKIDGAMFFLLGKNNQVYKIDASRSEMILDGFVPGGYALRVGDSVRVYGLVIGKQSVRAARVRIFKHDLPAAAAVVPAPAKEIKVIVEQEPEMGAGPSAPPVAPPVVCTWEGRGLITDIDYTGRKVKIRTSSGQYTINICSAQLSNGCRIVALGLLNQGDTVKVSGSLVGLNEVEAQDLSVVRTRSEAENAVPQMPLSIAGVIQQVDYTSMTFKMWTETTPIVVMVDKDTVIQEQNLKQAFCDLKPGMRVKMSGYGSLATGYAAQHIQIISVAP